MVWKKLESVKTNPEKYKNIVDTIYSSVHSSGDKSDIITLS